MLEARVYRRFLRLKRYFDRDDRVSLLLASRDPELAEYLQARSSAGSTHMEPDGKVFIKIDDQSEAAADTLNEEMAHALQYLRYGNVPLSRDDALRGSREIEVAECILGRKDRWKLSKRELTQLKRTIVFYGEDHDG